MSVIFLCVTFIQVMGVTKWYVMDVKLRYRLTGITIFPVS